MSQAPDIPPHDTKETPNWHSIDILGWKIVATRRPISSAGECDALQGRLGIPLPEMTFGGNSLELTHVSSGWRYVFDTEGALQGVKKGELGPGDGGVKVGYADAWMKSRTDPNSQMPLPATMATKPFDWTYTTTYAGAGSTVEWTTADPENAAHTIPMAELTRQDPILFYSEVPLFEDELHDNGTSQLTVRIRVMPTYFYILARLTLRVDGVLFRVHDTRMYHSFASAPPLVVRQVSGWEAPYNRVKRLLPRRDDLTPLTDPNFIGKVLSELPKQASQEDGAGTGWRGLGTRVEVAVLPAGL
ncbi:type 2A phosphatase activator TIP41 [Dentipellis sp. KUC8613]|nr:type 2A phosphatase activator TIP41 [Dentipellis sp. KUC8613]